MERLIKEMRISQIDNSKGVLDAWLTEHVGNLPEKVKKKFVKSVMEEEVIIEKSSYIAFLKELVKAFKAKYNEWPSVLK